MRTGMRGMPRTSWTKSIGGNTSTRHREQERETSRANGGWKAPQTLADGSISSDNTPMTLLRFSQAAAQADFGKVQTAARGNP